MNIFVAAIERVVVIILKGKSSEVLHTQGCCFQDRNRVNVGVKCMV